MFLPANAVLVSLALTAAWADPHAHDFHGGPLVPLATHGGLYGLGLDGEMSYGHPYPYQQPNYIAGPPKRGALGRGGSAAVKETTDIKGVQPLVHGGVANNGHLHDFQTGPLIDHVRGRADVYPGGPVPPPHPFGIPGHLGRPIDVNVFPVHPGLHGVARIDPGLYQEQLLRREEAFQNGLAPQRVHGGFRAPLQKDVDISNAVHEERLDKEGRLRRPLLGQQGLGRPFFNRAPLGGRPQQGDFGSAYVGKGSFGFGGAQGAYGPPGVGPNRISGPYLTPVSRFSDGYAYHRVPLALVEGGFVGHYYGTPVVHGIVKTGVPVSLIRGW